MVGMLHGRGTCLQNRKIVGFDSHTNLWLRKDSIMLNKYKRGFDLQCNYGVVADWQCSGLLNRFMRVRFSPASLMVP